MNSQILNIIQDIKLCIKDPQYKANLESLIQNYNNNNTTISTPTTERDIEIKRITDDYNKYKS